MGKFVKLVQSRHLASGVNYAQLRLLGALYTEGSQIMSELSTELQVTTRYVTKLVDALAAEGLVERRPHETDGRATVIALTPRGGSLGVLMSGPHQQEVARLFDCLSEEERLELLGLLKKAPGELNNRAHKTSCRELVLRSPIVGTFSFFYTLQLRARAEAVPSSDSSLNASARR